MKKVLKIVLILAVILLVLGIAAFYIKSMMPSGDGNNDIVEGY